MTTTQKPVLVTEATFIVKFPTPQDIEDHGSAMGKVYDALDVLFKAGVIADYNCSEMVEADDKAAI